MNILYDLVAQTNGDWETVREAMVHDPRIGESHTHPIDSSGHTNVPGRGAGGHCLIKDFEAFRQIYASEVNDPQGASVLRAMAEKNIALLLNSDKDVDLLEGVYGKDLSVED